MKKVLLIVLVIILAVATAKMFSISLPLKSEKTQTPPTESFIEITPQNLAEKGLFIGRSGVAIVDLRESAEYLKERIEGSIKRSPEEIISQVPYFEENYLTLVFVSKDGNQAKAAATALAQNSTKFNRKQIFVLSGGFDAWVKAGLPVKTSTGPR